MSTFDQHNSESEKEKSSSFDGAIAARSIEANLTEDQANVTFDPAFGMRRKKRAKSSDQDGYLSMSYVGAGITIAAVSFLICLQFGDVTFVLLAAAAHLIVGLLVAIAPKFFDRNAAHADRNSLATSNYWLELEEQNRNLIERLEQLEDASWEIRESEEIHRSLAAAFGDVVIHRNNLDEVIFSNSHFDSYFENGSQLPTATPPVISNKTGHHSVETREIEVSTKKGAIWFSWTDLIVRDPQTGEVGIRTVARDITDRKSTDKVILDALAKAKVANEAKSRFLATVSHEIRTPLNGVNGMASLLKDTQLQPDQRTYVDAIATSGETLLALIEDLLDSAQIESGRLTLKQGKTNIVSLVEGAAELLAPHANEKGVLLATYVDPNIPDNCIADEGRLRQVLLNLVGNAIKFTQAGGIGIEVVLAKNSMANSDNVRLEFSVNDSGSGLSEQDQTTIFDEFVQSDNSLTREHGGAGLGLAISQRLVGLMGGEINVDSVMGEGSCFSFSIDVKTDETSIARSHVEMEAGESLAVILPRSPARSALIKMALSTGRKVTSFGSIENFLATPGSRFKADTALVAQDEMARLERNGHELKAAHPRLQRAFLIGDQTGGQGANESGSNGYDGWLTWPVRSKTLKKTLDGHSEKATLDGELSQKCDGPEIKLNILVAEDNPINSLLAKSLLTKLGHGVCHVENGQVALDAYKVQTFDLVFMDMHMPVMDGITSIGRIREYEKKLEMEPVSIVVLSADGQAEAKNMAVKAGADDFLTKPLNIDAVKQLLIHQSNAV